MTELFDDFYKRFPRRVKPFNARKAYAKALTLATHEEIMEGLERFIKEEPWHGEIRFCPHPASWLNAGEWMNEYAEDSNPFGERLTATQALERNGTYPKLVEK